MNIVVTNLKGGVGKTTTAVYLAAIAVEKGYDPVVLIDADRQASSAVWLEERPVEGVTVVEAPSERTLTRALSKDDSLTVVDTPPGDDRIVQAAIDSADAVIIPTRAGGVEYPRVAVTLAGRRQFARVGRVFADAAAGGLLVHLDSHGLIAVAVNGGSAAERLGAAPGMRVVLEG